MNDTSAQTTWPQTLRSQIQRFWKPILFTACILICVFFAYQYHHRSTPKYVLEVMDRVNTPDDVQRYSTYFTPQGRDVLLWLMQKNGDSPSSGNKMSYSEPIINGDVCDIPAKCASTVLTIRLRRNGHWQFDDVYYASGHDRKIGLWISYVKDHPVLTYLKLNWRDLAGAFLSGVGAAAK